MNKEASYIIRKQKKKIFNLNKVIVYLRIKLSKKEKEVIELNEQIKELKKTLH